MTQRVALVTGASSGIGKATALMLNQAGYITYATARRLESLSDLERAGSRTLRLDVTDEASMIAAVETIEAEHSAIDVLVNNAGYGLNGPVEELEINAVRHEFETNVFGLVRMAQLVLPAMRRQNSGRIINVGSVGGTFTAPGAGAYHASKYAVEAFSDALRMETQSFGVQVVLIQPTGVYTAFDAKIAQTMPQTGGSSPYAFFKANHAKVTRRMFSGQGHYGIIKPEDVARTILQATQARRPQTRYKVGLSAHLYTGLRRILPDRIWDAMMMMQFPVHPRGNVTRSNAQQS
jgi:NADP-dependent 3-hydroxy acid dehydrogenase YdfG